MIFTGKPARLEPWDFHIGQSVIWVPAPELPGDEYKRATVTGVSTSTVTLDFGLGLTRRYTVDRNYLHWIKTEETFNPYDLRPIE